MPSGLTTSSTSFPINGDLLEGVGGVGTGVGNVIGPERRRRGQKRTIATKRRWEGEQRRPSFAATRRRQSPRDHRPGGRIVGVDDGELPSPAPVPGEAVDLVGTAASAQDAKFGWQ